ncbi:hypothetical protein [Nonomuraea sp. NPDC003214]
MSGTSPEVLAELAERLERLCREHGRGGQLAGMLADAGVEDLLDQLTTQVVADPQEPGRTRELLDAVDEVLAEQGVHALTRPNREWRPLPGVRPGQPELTAYVCPVRCCTRSSPEAGSCALSGKPLEALRLPS